MKVLTAAQKRFYDEEGYIIIENFVSPKELTQLKSALDRLLEEKTKTLTRDEGGFNLQRKRDVRNDGLSEGKLIEPGLMRKIQEITKYSPAFAELAEGARMLDFIEDLIGPDIYYHSSKLMFNPPRYGGGKPWHQDYAYWASTKPEQVTCWMALDDATRENGCMQLIPGSHKWGLVKHGQKELQVRAASLPLDQVKVAEMKAGSMLAFHVLTLHHSEPNRSDKLRRAFIVDYDPNRRPVKDGLAGDKLLRIGGRAPTAAEVKAAAEPVLAGV